MKRALAVVALVAGALVAPAGAGPTTTLVGENVPPRYLAWLKAAKAPTPRGVVRLVLAPCPGEEAAPTSLGCADADSVYIACQFFRPRCPRVEERLVFMHELGHVFDARHLDEVERFVVKAILGVEDRPWWGGEYEQQPGELFAHAYADCATFDRDRNRDLCAFLWRAGSSGGLDTIRREQTWELLRASVRRSFSG